MLGSLFAVGIPVFDPCKLVDSSSTNNSIITGNHKLYEILHSNNTEDVEYFFSFMESLYEKYIMYNTIIMAVENSRLVSELYQSRNVLMDIMETRGFNVEEYNNFSITEVNAMNKNEQLDLLLTNEIPQKGKIYIKYNTTKGLRPQNLDDMIEELFELEDILGAND